ncbi:MAG: GntR family transcriptional regulator [Azospirillaceae bacterium]
MTGKLRTPVAVPLYRQVKEILTSRVARGDWRPGEQLPSEPRIAQQLGVSPGTVRKALEEMTADGLVVRRQGAGTYVATATADSSLFRFFRLVNEDRERVMPSSREVRREVGPAQPREAAALSLETAEAKAAMVTRIRRIRHSAATPIMIETVVLPHARMRGVEGWQAELPNTLYDFYQEKFGVTIREVEEALRAVPADRETAQVFQMVEGAPVLEIERTAFTFDRLAVEYRRSLLDTTHFAYLSELS